MGDRVYASILFGGHIETVGEMEAFVEAIGGECLADDEDRNVRNAADAKKVLRRYIEGDLHVTFSDSERNYGQFDELEGMVKQIPGLGCVTNFAAGGGFDAGTKTVMPDGSEHHSVGSLNGSTVSLHEIIKARESPDALAEIDKIIEAGRLGRGDKLPKFTVSPAAAVWLKI